MTQLQVARRDGGAISSKLVLWVQQVLWAGIDQSWVMATTAPSLCVRACVY
jgi:hypothetical protein